MDATLDQIQQRLDDLKRLYDKRVDQTSSKASRSIILSLILLLILSVLGVWLFNRYTTATNERLDQLESTIKSSVASGQSIQSTTPGSQSESKSEIENLKARLASLETLQESMVNTSKGALEQMNFVFGITAAFLAMFSVFLAYRQTKADSSREKYDAEMTTLVESSRKNIDFINTLISTLEQSYKDREKIEGRIKTLDQQISEVEKYKQRSELSLREKIAGLNKESFQLFRGLDRETFKSEDNKGRLETFYVNMNTLEQLTDVSGLLSPFSFFLRALHFFNVTQYQPAQEDLKKAHKLGFREVAKKTAEWYGDEVEAELDKQLSRMLVDCSYHLGITHYNLGEYKEARERFDEAFRSNPLDFRSRSYIPELKFFDSKINFSEVMAEFESVERELNALSIPDRDKIDWSAAMASLKIREGNCYLPKLFTIRGRERYRGEENVEQAVRIYLTAHEEAKKTRKPNLTEIFTRFSLAQALELAGPAESINQRPHDLFRGVFNDVRNQIVLKSEPILLVLLNYTLAICAKRADISGENPKPYLARAREQLQRVPAQVRIFSPITKINLTRQEILWHNLAEEQDKLEKKRTSIQIQQAMLELDTRFERQKNEYAQEIETSKIILKLDSDEKEQISRYKQEKEELARRADLAEIRRQEESKEKQRQLELLRHEIELDQLRVKRAELQREIAKQESEIMDVTGKAQAEIDREKTLAAHAHTMRMNESLLTALPGILEKAYAPTEKLGEVKVLYFGGRNISSGDQSPTDQALGTVLSSMSIIPMIKEVLRFIGSWESQVADNRKPEQDGVSGHIPNNSRSVKAVSSGTEADKIVTHESE